MPRPMLDPVPVESIRALLDGQADAVRSFVTSFHEHGFVVLRADHDDGKLVGAYRRLDTLFHSIVMSDTHDFYNDIDSEDNAQRTTTPYPCDVGEMHFEHFSFMQFREIAEDNDPPELAVSRFASIDAELRDAAMAPGTGVMPLGVELTRRLVKVLLDAANADNDAIPCFEDVRESLDDPARDAVSATILRCCAYPPVPKQELTDEYEEYELFHAHSDVGLVTFAPIARVPGLEVQLPLLDSWLMLESEVHKENPDLHLDEHVGPLFIFFCSDTLEWLSDGNFKPLSHRVVSNPLLHRLSYPLLVRLRPKSRVRSRDVLPTFHGIYN